MKIKDFQQSQKISLKFLVYTFQLQGGFEKHK